MCSHYQPADERDLERYGVSWPDNLKGEKDVFPGGAGPLIFQEPGLPVRSCVAGTFGLLPVWARDRTHARRTYNARSETVSRTPSFRNAWKQDQVCIVPAKAIYEPSYETGKPEWWRIARADGVPLALAGLWERKQWEEGALSWSFTLLTVNAEAHPVMRRFHKPTDEKRSVVVLDGAEIEAWLACDSKTAMCALIKPCAEDLLVAAPGRL